jgi:hypothetical protein
LIFALFRLSSGSELDDPGREVDLTRGVLDVMRIPVDFCRLGAIGKGTDSVELDGIDGIGGIGMDMFVIVVGLEVIVSVDVASGVSTMTEPSGVVSGVVSSGIGDERAEDVAESVEGKGM